MAAVKILHQSPEPSGRWTLDKAAATNIKKGQFLSFESGAVVHMDAEAEDATFAGIAAHDATNSETEILVLKKCTIEVDATSAAYTPGQDVKYAAGGSTTDYSVADADANAIGNVAKEYPASSTRIRVNIDVDALKKLTVQAA